MNLAPDKKKANCENALRTFEEFARIADPTSAIDVAGLIKSFELSYETLWKLFQDRLDKVGVATASPRAAFKAAFVQGWIDSEITWLDMLMHRNLTVHTYNRDLATEIFEAAVERYVVEMRKAFEAVTTATG